MKRITTLAVALSLAIPAAAFACDHENKQASLSSSNVPLIVSFEPGKLSVTELAALTKEKRATPVDANSEETRAKNGVIPGAVLLTSSSQYELAELPANKGSKLVFYCASQKCSASHKAAKKAMEAGYTDVAVMPDGITGWKNAGQPTAKPNS